MTASKDALYSRRQKFLRGPTLIVDTAATPPPTVFEVFLSILIIQSQHFKVLRVNYTLQNLHFSIVIPSHKILYIYILVFIVKIKLYSSNRAKNYTIYKNR